MKNSILKSSLVQISKEKDFGKHCQLYISIELILTEKKIEKPPESNSTEKET